MCVYLWSRVVCSRQSNCPLCPAAAVQCGRPPPEEHWGPTRTPGRRLCVTLQQSTNTNVRESQENSSSRSLAQRMQNFICARIYMYNVHRRQAESACIGLSA